MRWSISQAQIIPQEISAIGAPDCFLVAPAVAAEFSARRGFTSRHSLGQYITEIEIAANAFLVNAINTKYRFGVVEIHVVFDLAAPAHAVRRVISEFHDQGFQPGKRS